MKKHLAPFTLQGNNEIHSQVAAPESDKDLDFFFDSKSKEFSSFKIDELLYILTLERVSPNFVPLFSFNENLFPSNLEPYKREDVFTYQIPKPYSKESPIYELPSFGGFGIKGYVDIINAMYKLSKGKSYKEYVGFILDSLDIEYDVDYSCEELEMQLIFVIFSKMLDRLPLELLDSIITLFNLKAESSPNSIRRALQRKDFDKVNLGISSICATSIVRWFEIQVSYYQGKSLYEIFYDTTRNDDRLRYKNELYFNMIEKHITPYILELINKLPQECRGISAILLIANARQYSNLNQDFNVNKNSKFDGYKL